MSGAAIAGAVVAVAGAAATAYSSRQQAKAQKSAAKQQAAQAAEANKQQQIQFNKENQNEVDVSGILAANQGGDAPATLLTGPQGVGKNNLQLGGGSSLLGG